MSFNMFGNNILIQKLFKNAKKIVGDYDGDRLLTWIDLSNLNVIIQVLQWVK